MRLPFPPPSNMVVRQASAAAGGIVLSAMITVSMPVMAQEGNSPKDGGGGPQQQGASPADGPVKDAMPKPDAEPQKRNPTPEEKMAKRFPQPVLVSDLLRFTVSGTQSEWIGPVQAVVRTNSGKVQVVVGLGGLFGFGRRPVAFPVEVLATIGRELVLKDLEPDSLGQLPTWYGSETTSLDPTEKVSVALVRR